jgi:hypothetical protein
MRSEPPRLVDSDRPDIVITQPDGLRAQREMMITEPDGLNRRALAGVTTEPPGRPEDGHRPSTRPTASFGPARNAEQDFFEAAGGPQKLSSLPPELVLRKARSPARAMFAKVLFVMIFAGVATLLGVAIKKKLELRKVDSLSAFVR